MSIVRIVKRLIKPLLSEVGPHTLYFVKNESDVKSDFYISTANGDALIDVATENLRLNTVRKYAPHFSPMVLALAFKDTSSAITVGNDVAYIRSPRPFRLRHIRASVFSASTSGDVSINVKINGASVIDGLELSIDANETSSLTAVVDYNASMPANGITVNNDDIISYDVVSSGTGATGLVVQFHEGPDIAYTYN